MPTFFGEKPPPDVYAYLRGGAVGERRSLPGHTLHLLEPAFASPPPPGAVAPPPAALTAPPAAGTRRRCRTALSGSPPGSGRSGSSATARAVAGPAPSCVRGSCRRGSGASGRRRATLPGRP